MQTHWQSKTHSQNRSLSEIHYIFVGLRALFYETKKSPVDIITNFMGLCKLTPFQSMLLASLRPKQLQMVFKIYEKNVIIIFYIINDYVIISVRKHFQKKGIT